MNKTLLVWLIPMIQSFPALAEESPASTLGEVRSASTQPPSHFYLGGRLGGASFQDACGSEAYVCNDETFGGGIYGGYQFNDWFALEGGVTDYGKPDARYDAAARVSADTFGAELSAKLSYSLSSEWTLFGRLGASYQDIEKVSDLSKKQSSQDWNTLVALGVNYRLSPQWSLRSEYQFIDGIGDGRVLQSDLHFTSLGLTYHFGHHNPILNTSAVPMPLPELAPTVVMEKVSLDTDILFAFDSFTIQNSDELDQLVAVLKRATLGQVTITGYTDSRGAMVYNQDLSERRANTVAEYLFANGVTSERLIVLGLGENQPVASNETRNGRAKNRRVEVHFEVQKEREER
ncbi:OmpA family protein [Vibrio hyugaensis]|uniref:OmpA family protein n=1 Tax=Vibrio hyugaensis TaxID=1534743 RepID=UPI0005ED9F8B|nr:OmpA family protein [Vibrio hyugaensis]